MLLGMVVMNIRCSDRTLSLPNLIMDFINLDCRIINPKCEYYSCVSVDNKWGYTEKDSAGLMVLYKEYNETYRYYYNEDRTLERIVDKNGIVEYSNSLIRY